MFYTNKINTTCKQSISYKTYLLKAGAHLKTHVNNVHSRHRVYSLSLQNI